MKMLLVLNRKVGAISYFAAGHKYHYKGRINILTDRHSLIYYAARKD